jgi:RNA polymerase sigma factor (sigma-70 family)
MKSTLAGERLARLSEQPDGMIIGLAIDGHKQAFTELVLRHSARIRNLLRRLCGQHSLADDLAQLTFVQVWKNISRLKSAAAFVTWSNRIAVNVWLEEQRRVTPLTTSDPEVMTNLVDLQPAPDQHLAGLDLERALSQLAAAERLCVVMAFGEGYTHEQIAEIADIPLGTAKSHVLRGSAKLKELLGGTSIEGNEHA